MELIESEEEKKQAPLPEPEPRYQTTTLPVEKTEHGQAWIRLALATLLAVILVILIVLLARWIYHKAHNHAGSSTGPHTPAVSVNNPPAAPAPSPSSGRPSANTPNPAGSNTPSPSQIANTGPGNAVAIFVGASLAAAGLHYLVTVRRFAKNS